MSTDTTTTPTLFDNTINRPSPWWSTPTARDKLLKLAQPLTHQEDDSAQIDLEQLDDQHGYYVYSKQILTQRFNNLSQLQSVDRVFFAQKANNCPEIIQLFYSLGAGIECVSLNELKLVLSLIPNINGDRLLWTPNFAAQRELKALQQLFNTETRRNDPEITQLFPFVTIDNMYILENWDIPKIFDNIPIFLRVAPSTDGYGHHSHVSTGASSKFGIFNDDLVSFFTTNPLGKEYAPLIRGLHMHKGSGVSTSSEWANTAQTLLSHLSLFPNMSHIDIGGGLSIPYKPTDVPFDLISLDNSLLQVKQQYPQIKFCVEPGRYLVAESGVILTRINQLKSKSCHKFIGIAIGMNGLIRPALYNSYHHIVNLTKFDQMYLQQARAGLTVEQNTNYQLGFDNGNTNGSVITHIVGPICETGDYLGKDRIFPASSAENDIVLIDCTGAYGRVMASNYNLRATSRDIVVDFE